MSTFELFTNQLIKRISSNTGSGVSSRCFLVRNAMFSFRVRRVGVRFATVLLTWSDSLIKVVAYSAVSGPALACVGSLCLLLIVAADKLLLPGITSVVLASAQVI